MDAPTFVAHLQQALPGVAVESAPSLDRHLTIYVAAADLPAVARVLQRDDLFRCNLLAEITAVDFWPREPRFELVYILVSLELRLRVRLKVRLSGDAARVATVTNLWPGANWLEREVWDLFGIEFDGHPDPRRLLMPEDWEGFPLRKDYPVQIKMPARTGAALQVTEAEFRANVERDRMTRK